MLEDSRPSPPWVWEGRVAIPPTCDESWSLHRPIRLQLEPNHVSLSSLLSPQGPAWVLIWISRGHPQTHRDRRLDVVNGSLRCHACLGDSQSEERSGSLSIPHTLDHQSGKPYLLFHSYYFPYYLFFLVHLFTPRMAYRSLNLCPHLGFISQEK